MRGLAIEVVMLTTGHCDEWTKFFTAMRLPGFLHRPLIPSNDGIHILLFISMVGRRPL